MSADSEHVETQVVAVETQENPRPITRHPDTSLPANAPQELVQKAVDAATAEAPKTGHVTQEVVVKDDSEAK